jgi:type IV pilus assembly protein PilM
MPMLSSKKKKDAPLVGLDLGAGSIAAAELRVNGTVQVERAAIGPLEGEAFRDGEVGDADLLAATLRDFFGSHGLGKKVRVGLASQRVAFRTILLPPIENPDELRRAVLFQAKDEIPMPLENAVLDYQVVGGAETEDGTKKLEVALVAARRELVMRLVLAIRAAGLQPVGVDLTAFGMIRALAGNSPAPDHAEPAGAGDAPSTATLYCSFGDVTNLAIARRFSCLFARVSHSGLDQIAGRLAERTGLTQAHSRQWLGHVGLERPVEEIEGDHDLVVSARAVLEEGAAILVDDLRLTLDYYGAQDRSAPVGTVVISGDGSAIPGLPERLTSDLNREVTVRYPGPLADMPRLDAARLTNAYGLALNS